MSHDTVAALTGDQALKELLMGNDRYVNSQQIHPRQTGERRSEVAGGQQPFAIVLTCADSRLSPELIFDQGLGDLFVIRVAGNIIDDAILGSIEYAAEHLHSPLLVVLGHSSCGAVGATVAGGELAGHLPSLARAIGPAVDRVRNQGGDLLDNAVRANAKMVAEQLQSSQPVLANLAGAGRLKVVAAYYDLTSGKVTILS
jgi:carbonic anhydrase